MPSEKRSRWFQSALSGSLRGDALATAFVLGSTFAWGWAAIHLNPAASLNSNFLFRDAAHVLVTTDDLLAGKLLYRDVFYVYGAISAYLYAAVAALFGNAALTLLYYQLTLSLAVILLAYRLLRKCLPPWPSATFLILALFPLLIMPGSATANLFGVDYVSLERLLILALAVSWRDISRRTLRYSATVGCVLGLMQDVRFGSAFVAGAALVAVDTLSARSLIANAAVRWQWFRANLALLGTFCVWECARIGIAFAVLPDHIAREVAWPAYLIASYASYVGQEDRWPHWLNPGYFVTAQFAFGAALILFIGWFCCKLVRGWERSTPQNEGGFAFLGLFFLIGSAILFRHVWHFYQYAWTVTLAAAYLLAASRRFAQVFLLLIWLPMFSSNVRTVFASRRDPQLRALQFSNGETLWLDPETRNQADLLMQARANWPHASDTQPTAMFFPDAAGFHHYLQVQHVSRFFFFMGGFVQSDEEKEFIADVSRCGAVVAFLSPLGASSDTARPDDWVRGRFLTPLLSNEVNTSIAALLNPPLAIGENCRLYPVKSASDELRPVVP